MGMFHTDNIFTLAEDGEKFALTWLAGEMKKIEKTRQQHHGVDTTKSCPRCEGVGRSAGWNPHMGICYQCDGAKTVPVKHGVKDPAYKAAVRNATLQALRMQYRMTDLCFQVAKAKEQVSVAEGKPWKTYGLSKQFQVRLDALKTRAENLL